MVNQERLSAARPGPDAPPETGSGAAASLDQRVLELIRTESRLVRKYLVRPQRTTVSVVMPTWNRAHVVRRAVDSVLRQRYRNFELIIADDGSDDETARLLEEGYADETRIRYLTSSHGGASVARNLALQSARGDLVAYLDTDNEWSQNYLLIMVNALLDRPEADCLYCGLRVVDRTASTSYVRARPFDRAALVERNFIDINVFLHRRHLVERCGGFDPEIRAVEDWDLVLRYTAEQPPAFVPCVLATYYLEADLSHSSRTPEIWENYRKVRERFHPEGGEAKFRGEPRTRERDAEAGGPHVP